MPGILHGILYMVRHGESAGNVNPGLRRSDDPPLTDRGREQAARAAAALAGVDAVLSSPLRRARETARAIAEAAGLGAGLVAVEGFGEVDMGSLADAEAPEGQAEREAIFSAWLRGDTRRSFPGGEGFDAVLRRVGQGLRDLARATPGSRIALVTHRMPIAAAVALCAPGGRAGPAGACPNGSITTLEREGEGWRLVSFADARHLA